MDGVSFDDVSGPLSLDSPRTLGMLSALISLFSTTFVNVLCKRDMLMCYARVFMIMLGLIMY